MKAELNFGRTKCKTQGCEKVYWGEEGWLANGTGCYCPKCTERWYQRMREGTLRKMAAKRKNLTDSQGRKLCKYSRYPLTEANPPASGDPDGFVSESSAKVRDAALRLIRRSPEFAKYVARTEEREAPERDARLAEEAKRNEQPDPGDAVEGMEKLRQIEEQLRLLKATLGIDE